jgi:hypothetical protein
MKTLQIIRIKPNPSGKDRNRHGASPAQLGAEWVDFQNIGDASVSLDNVQLYHIAYHAGQGHWAHLMTFRGTLGAGEIVRVHSGQVRNVSVLYQEDINGAHDHLFTGQDAYVWNNREGDTPSLRDGISGGWIDQASYDPNPPDGEVLVRWGNKLVLAMAASRYRGW